MTFDINEYKKKLQGNLTTEKAGSPFSQSKNTDVIKKTGNTALDLGANVGIGIAQGVEGLVDFGAQAVGMVGGLFDKDFKSDMFGWANKSYTNDFLLDPYLDSNIAQNSFLNQGFGKYAREVAQAVGAMLPSIAIGNVAGALGASSTVANAISLGSFGLQAAGQSSNEAYNEGANPNQAFTYGALSGAKETAIEALSGNLFGMASKPMGNVLGSRPTRNIVKQLGKSFVEEGTEEVIGDLIDPFLKAATYTGKVEMPSFKELLHSFTIGGVAGGVMGGADIMVNAQKYGVNGYKAQMVLEDITNVNSDYEKLALKQNGKLTEEQIKTKNDKMDSLADELEVYINEITNERKQNNTMNVIKPAIAAINSNYDAGLSLGENVKSINPEENISIAITDAVNRKLGANKTSRFSDEIADGVNGVNTKDINVISRNGSKNKIETLKHETLGHEMLKTSKRNDINEYVKENYTELSKGKDFKASYNEYKEMYKSEILQYKSKLRNSEEYKNLPNAKAQEKYINDAVDNYIMDEMTSDIISNTFTLKDIKNMISRKPKLIKNLVSSLSGKTYKEREFIKLYNKALETVNLSNNVSVNNDINSKDRFSVNNTVVEYDKARQKVLTEVEKEKIRLVDMLGSNGLKLQMQFIDAQAGIVALGKKLGMKDIDEATNVVRSASSQADNWLKNGQFTKDGKKINDNSLEKIFRYVKKNHLESEFYTYLLHYHNIDRLNFMSRINNKKTNLLDENKNVVKNGDKAIKVNYSELKNMPKPVFGEEVTIADSEKAIKAYEASHPEFKEMAENVWEYTSNMLDLRESFNLISRDTKEILKSSYPHYVPTYRDMGEKPSFFGSMSKDNNISVTIKGAKGSDLNILPIDVILARQTMQIFKAGRLNELGNKIYDNAQASKSELVKSNEILTNEVAEELDLFAQDEYTDMLEDKKGNKFINSDGTITINRDGKKVTLSMPKEAVQGFEYYVKSTLEVPVLSQIMKYFKKLIIDWNPGFTVRNAVRDFQDGAINTRYGAKFAKTYLRAVQEMKSNSEYWQEYQAMGGVSSSVYDYTKGYNVNINKVEALNQAIEQIPRFAEYILARESGKTVERALYEAQDVTVNFGRAGYVAKALNKNIIPFFTASIGGFNKITRTLFTKKLSGILSLLINATIYGIGIDNLLRLLYDDDEEYKELPMRYRENYFCFKVGKSWLRLPKGRLVSSISGLYQRTKEAEDGGEFAFDEWLGNTISQLSPIDIGSSGIRTILDPVMRDLITNKTWYGSDIENQALQKYKPGERADETATYLAKTIGKALNISPKKLDYVFDQYSGVIGDIVIPLTQEQKTNKIPIVSSFLIGKNETKYQSNLYDTITKLEQEYNSTNDLATKAQLRYLNRINGEISDLIKDKKAVTDAEEKETIQALINNLSKSALTSYKIFGAELKKYEMDEETYEDVYLNAYRNVFGAESALRIYNAQVYEKAASICSTNNIPFETYFDFYFDVNDLEADYDNKGNIITGSRKKKVIQIINSLKLNSSQKKALLTSLGYK